MAQRDGTGPIVRTGRLLFVPLAAALVLTACSATATGAGTDESPRAVDLTMTDEMGFEPARIEVGRGETVLFRVRNVSHEGHEAYIGTDAEQRLHEARHYALRADEQTQTAHMGYGIHVARFGTGELVFRFDEDTEYVVGCHYPGHYEAGMRAVIEVSD